MYVIGGQKPDAIPAGHVKECFVYLRQFWNAMFLQLDEEAIFSEHIQVVAHQPVGFLQVSAQYRLGYFRC